MKEISPLLAHNGQNTAFFGVPGRRIFHGTPQHLTQGRYFFHHSSTPAPQAGQKSPCSAPSASRRDKTHPARTKRAKKGYFGRAGRVLYRKWPRAARAGRILYRQRPYAVLGGEYCLTSAPPVSPVADLPPPTGAAAWPGGPFGVLRALSGGGFALHEAFRGCVTGVSEPHVVQFPPFGGDEAATHSSMVPKVQSTSAKTGENGLSWARWSTFWEHRCLARCMCSQVSPLFRVPTR